MADRLTSAAYDVPDITQCGAVTVIGLKKSGSGQIQVSFRGKTWEQRQFDDNNHRWVTAFRNPAARLVSAWNHLVRPRYELPGPSSEDIERLKEKFGPHWDFPEWCDWVLSLDPETMNAHFRPQTYELADVLRGEDGLIFIAQLERLTEIAKGPLTEWLRWSGGVPGRKMHSYSLGSWRDYYDRDRLRAVHKFYALDDRLWRSIQEKGFEVVGTRRLVEYLDLTNR